jgi:hypothetical protein
MIIEWALIYIVNYQKIRKRVLREAKERIMINNAKSVDKPKGV